MRTMGLKPLVCVALIFALLAAVLPAWPVQTAVADAYVDEVELLENMSYTAYVGSPFRITTGGKEVKHFKSDSSHIARVDDDGVVTPRKAGSTKIKVTLTNKKTLTLKLKVLDLTMPTGITLLETGTVKVDMDDTLQLHYILEPSTAESEVSWKSSNTLVAKVKDGLITPKKTGTSTITVTTKRGDKKATVTVKVTDKTVPSSITLSESGTLDVYLQQESLTLGYELRPAGSYSGISWKSDNITVAKVDDGVVKLRRAGKATITATTKRGNKKASVKLKIIDGAVPTGITIDQGSSISLAKGQTLQLTTTVTTAAGFPADTKYTWSSNKGGTVSVSRHGEVEAKKKGTAKITVKTKNGKKATITITVY